MRTADERPVRRLWGKGTGSFKTKARFSSATVRGTTWLTEDRCDGSLIQSDEGTVEVYDYSLRRLVLVAAGNRYLAQAPPAPTPGRFVGDPTGTVLINGQPVTQDTQVRNGDTVDVRNGRLLLGRRAALRRSTAAGSSSTRRTRAPRSPSCASPVGTSRRRARPREDRCGRQGQAEEGEAEEELDRRPLALGRRHRQVPDAGPVQLGDVRGTVWLTVDRCDGSLVRVVRGRVEVQDFTQRKTVFVNAGGQYLAPAPG